MIINHNMNAMNAHRNMSSNIGRAGKSMEKLSSGLRINRAGDDAAGLAISEKMRGQIRGLDQASRNSQDGISMIQTAEGALNETHSILQRMRELAVQAGNDTNKKEDRDQIQEEINQLTSEINRIGNTTEFNKQKVLDGGAAAKTAGTGEKEAATPAPEAKVTGGTIADLNLSAKDLTMTINGTDVTLTKADYSGKGDDLATDLQAAIKAALGTDDVKVSFDTDHIVLTSSKDMEIAEKTPGDLAKLGLKAETAKLPEKEEGETTEGSAFTTKAGVTDGTTNNAGESALDVSSHDNATSAIETLDKAINKVSTQRSKLGAMQNRLEHTINNLGTSSENLTAAESRIRDVDMAKEMMTFSKENILQQAAQAMLAQAKQAPQGVLQLLR